MIRNYFKIAFRSLLKNKSYSFLNIFGLTIGITCASLILLWVEDEVNFNSVFEKQDQIFYAPTNHNFDGEWRTFYSSPGPLAKALKDEIPEIVRATITHNTNLVFPLGENTINSTGKYAEADIFEIFNLTFIKGNAIDAFKNPEAIVLTEKTAALLYGKNKNVLGEAIRMNNGDNYVVTGIIKNLPKNVTFGFNWLAPFERYAKGKDWILDYNNNFADTFVELSPEANFEKVDTKVRQFLLEKNKESHSNTYAFLHSIKDWHLRSKFEDGKIVGGRITYVRLFGLIAFIILLIACINFMNLSTARSEKRANEVGVRKAMGSSRHRLILQFISEALTMALIAGMFSVFLLLLILPQFNILVEKELVLNHPFYISVLFGIATLCGILSGVYPALYLSSFKPVDVLKGLQKTGNSVLFIRKGLIVGQFIISIIFITCTILIYQQIQYAKNRESSYDKDQLIVMTANQETIQKFSAIKQDLIHTGEIKNAALSNSIILSEGRNRTGLKWDGATATEDILITLRYVSPAFMKTTGMEIAEGRDFSENMAKDSINVIITESFANLMGEGSPLGKRIFNDEKTYQVIGVVKDYLYGDMYGKSDPVLFFNNSNFGNYLYVKTQPDIAMNSAISSIETIMKKHNPAFPFDYALVDDIFKSKFKSEQLVGTLSQIFALLAILISCLGLFGLTAYTAEQRSKEIGIRKILGASVAGIVQLLSKDFLKLVLISLVIAIPIAWLTIRSWLQDFAYRIEINWWVFVLAGTAAIFIALVTVSFQAIKVAITNPINSLRTE